MVSVKDTTPVLYLTPQPNLSQTIQKPLHYYTNFMLLRKYDTCEVITVYADK
jgi:hypothetical protein